MNENQLNESVRKLTQVIWSSAILCEAARLAGTDDNGIPKKVMPENIEQARNEFGLAWKAASEDSGYGII